jgi:hypothetical protein
MIRYIASCILIGMTGTREYNQSLVFTKTLNEQSQCACYRFGAHIIRKKYDVYDLQLSTNKNCNMQHATCSKLHATRADRDNYWLQEKLISIIH